MSDQARHVFQEALRLPASQRADLAAELLRSLDDDEDEQALPPKEVDQRWAEEITRRAERALRGETTGRDAEAVLSAVESKLRRR